MDIQFYSKPAMSSDCGIEILFHVAMHADLPTVRRLANTAKALETRLINVAFMQERQWNFFFCAPGARAIAPRDRSRLAYAELFARTLLRVVTTPNEEDNKVLVKVIFGRLRCRYRDLYSMLKIHCLDRKVSTCLEPFFGPLARLIPATISDCKADDFRSIAECVIKFAAFFGVDLAYDDPRPGTEMRDQTLLRYIEILDILGFEVCVHASWKSHLPYLPEKPFKRIESPKKRARRSHPRRERRLVGLKVTQISLAFDLGRPVDFEKLASAFVVRNKTWTSPAFEVWIDFDVVLIFPSGRCVFAASNLERGDQLYRYIHEKLEIPIP